VGGWRRRSEKRRGKRNGHTQSCGVILQGNHTLQKQLNTSGREGGEDEEKVHEKVMLWIMS
jgi:hypothetical protein